jgi:hypothetical protein
VVVVSVVHIVTAIVNSWQITVETLMPMMPRVKLHVVDSIQMERMVILMVTQFNVVFITRAYLRLQMPLYIVHTQAKQVEMSVALIASIIVTK